VWPFRHIDLKEQVSGAKAQFGLAFIARAEARAYLRSNSKDNSKNSKNNRNSNNQYSGPFAPLRMTRFLGT
jgi:hypothetical protein